MGESSADIAKRVILRCIGEGMIVEDACKEAGKSLKTYEYYRRSDKSFADKVDRTRLGLKDKTFASGDVHDLSFAEFRSRFLHQHTFAQARPIVQCPAKVVHQGREEQGRVGHAAGDDDLRIGLQRGQYSLSAQVGVGRDQLRLKVGQGLT